MQNGLLGAYIDPTHGFAIYPPRFPAGLHGTSFAAVTFCGPPNGPLCSNVNVVIQNMRLSPSEYWELTLANSRKQDSIP